jgi:hypothetical protein
MRIWSHPIRNIARTRRENCPAFLIDRNQHPAGFEPVISAFGNQPQTRHFLPGVACALTDQLTGHMVLAVEIPVRPICLVAKGGIGIASDLLAQDYR